LGGKKKKSEWLGVPTPAEKGDREREDGEVTSRGTEGVKRGQDHGSDKAGGKRDQTYWLPRLQAETLPVNCRGRGRGEGQDKKIGGLRSQLAVSTCSKAGWGQAASCGPAPTRILGKEARGNRLSITRRGKRGNLSKILAHRNTQRPRRAHL